MPGPPSAVVPAAVPAAAPLRRLAAPAARVAVEVGRRRRASPDEVAKQKDRLRAQHLQTSQAGFQQGRRDEQVRDPKSISVVRFPSWWPKASSPRRVIAV